MAAAFGAMAGGMMQAQAAGDAASMQKQSADKATNQQWSMYQQNRADQAPWRNTGSAALGQLSWLLGLGGGGSTGGSQATGFTPFQGSAQQLSDRIKGIQGNVVWVDKNGNPVPSMPGTTNQGFAGTVSNITNALNSGWTPMDQQQFDAIHGGTSGTPGQSMQGNMADFGRLTRGFDASQMYNDPGYQFRLQEGQKALERSGAAKGMSLSGAQLKGIGRYSQDYASNEYGNAFNRYNTENTNLYNRLSNLAGMGQVSANNIGQFGQNTANQMGQYMTGAGNAMGASAIAQGNAWSNAFNSGMNAWNQYNAMNNNNQGGGSGSGGGYNTDWSNGYMDNNGNWVGK